MIKTCKTGCNPAVTIEKTDHCKVFERSENMVRLLYRKCDFNFPTGVYTDNALAVAFEAGITSGDIGASFEIANSTWADPTFVEKKYRSKKKRAKSTVVGRDLTVQTYVATDVDPAGTASPYWDREFYVNVENNAAVEVCGWVTHEGNVELALDDQGQFMDNVVESFVGQDQELDTDTIEVKNFKVKFSGDPLQRRILPYLDINAANAAATLGWLSEGNPVV